jgi:UDP-hydrolysing UDP-N-acetyl-D-glucosamine 2-epimerase
MRPSRRIAVVTGTRAEYGLLRPLMALLRSDGEIDFRLVVCAAHLSPEFGLTKDRIQEDGFWIDDEVEMLLSSDTASGIAKSVGLGCIGFADVFRRAAPDLIVVLGDRFEVLAAVQAAMFAQIPVAHLHGGELTEGVVDDGIRHAVTKMSHLHFVSTEVYRRRVIQLGETPSLVFQVGAIGLDTVRELKPTPRTELGETFGIPANREFLLLSWHPETLSSRPAGESISTVLAALARREEAIVMSYPNADQSSRDVISEIEAFAAQRPGVVLVKSFGPQAYLSIMSHARAIIGNSSSGIIEAPSLGVPTINIGSRQKGRVRAPSVIDCAVEQTGISAALEQAMSPSFRAEARRKENPYGDGHTARRVMAQLKTVRLEGLVYKVFHDIPTQPGRS